MSKILFLTLIFFFSINMSFAQAKNKLIIYTYKSFTEPWGTGPRIKKEFEKKCDCNLVFISVTDGVALLNRIKIEKESIQADIVLGLDNNLIVEAKKTNLFIKYRNHKNINLPIEWNDDVFVPFDYGYLAVIYNKVTQKNPPTSLQELVESKDPSLKLTIQDPRTSTPGLGFLLWVKYVYGSKAREAWIKLRKKIQTITPGWGESYALFIKGEVPMTISYTSSPAYHLTEEKTDKYQAASFREGHYLHIEVAGITKKGEKNPLSEQFIKFMTEPDFQNIIPETNWMWPAGETSVPLTPAFKKLIKPSKTCLFSADEVEKNRKLWIEEWLSAMGQ